jgi:Ca2+-binding RTX toxin-like protein
MAIFYGLDDSSVSTLLASGTASSTLSLDQSRLFVARRDGVVEVRATANGAVLGSVNLGTGLGAITLSDDGTYLLVTRADHAGTIYRITILDLSVQTYSFAGQVYDIEAITATTAIVTGPVTQLLDLATGTFTPLSGAFGGSTVIVEDNRFTLFAQTTSSNGQLQIYDDLPATMFADGDNYQSGMVSGFNWGVQAISGMANQVAQFAYFGSINIYDMNLHPITVLNVGERVDGLAYSADGMFLYVYKIDSGVVAKYSTSTFTLVDQYAVATSSWHNNIGYGDQLHIANDGSFLTVMDNSATGALRLVQLTGRNETFAGTSGADTFYGLRGDDIYVYNDAGDAAFEIFAQGTDRIRSSINATIAANVEILELTGASALVATGNDQNNILIGNAAASTLLGMDGDDRLEIGTGANGTLIDGGSGLDTLAISGTVTSLAGLASIELLEFVGGANLTLTGSQFASLAFNTVLLGSGSVTINMEPGFYFVTTQFFVGFKALVSFNVIGTSGADIIKFAQNMPFEVHGGDGSDQIRGGPRADTIFGDGGNDKIFGLTGADQLTGGAGADQFRYIFYNDSSFLHGADTILDFEIGIDKIDFRGFDTNFDEPGRQLLSFIGTSAFAATGAGQVRYENFGTDLLVSIDYNGNGVADMQIILADHSGQTLTATDFLF